MICIKMILFIFWRVLSTGSCILAQLVYIALQLTEIEKDYIIVSRSTALKLDKNKN